MVDTKKEQERDELHRAIWAIADELHHVPVLSYYQQTLFFSLHFKIEP